MLEIGWAAALYHVANGLVEMIVGKLCHEIKTMERVMIAGFILNTLATFSFYLVTDVNDMFAVNIVIGISRGLAGPTWNALYQLANSTNPNVADAWGKSSGLGNFCMALSVLGCSYLATKNFGLAIGIMGAIQALATIFLYRIVHYRSAHAEPNAKQG